MRSNSASKQVMYSIIAFINLNPFVAARCQSRKRFKQKVKDSS
jgi:hypothetical protein